MKKILLISMLFLSLISCKTIGFLHKLNKAQKLYLNNVEYVQNILSGKEKPTLQKVNDLTSFFTEITDVEINALDLLHNVEGESSLVNNLENWYKQNKDRLQWDEENQRVILRE